MVENLGQIARGKYTTDVEIVNLMVENVGQIARKKLPSLRVTCIGC